ncbi:MAG: hypothetical protein U0235_27205 [Polyangiaceae bacterium]
MRLRSRLAPLVFALSVFSISSAAYAQNDADKATARQLGQEGQEAFEKKDFKTAEDRFKRADSLFHAPTLALGLARAYAANAKFVEAQETYNRIIREGAPAGSPPAFQNAVDAAKAEVASVAGKIGSVVINVSGAESPKVTLDDQPFPNAALSVKRAANPGAHVVRATADGYRTAEARVTVTEAGSATATLTLEKIPTPSPRRPSSGRRPAWPWPRRTGGAGRGRHRWWLDQDDRPRPHGRGRCRARGRRHHRRHRDEQALEPQHRLPRRQVPRRQEERRRQLQDDGHDLDGRLHRRRRRARGRRGPLLHRAQGEEERVRAAGPTASANGSLGGASIGAVGQF